MSMINCPDCRKSISASVATCPKCGRTITPEDVARGKKINKFSSIASAVIIGTILLTFAFCVFKGKSSPGEIAISARVYSNGSQILIENRDKYDWTDVKIRLNDKFVLKADLVKAGKTYKVGVRQFADMNNNTFNPYLMKPKSVSIACEMTNARAFYYSEFK